MNKTHDTMTLGDITANDVFFYSTIQFWTTGGANNKVTVGELKNVSENYVYWPEGSGAADGKFGWYLEDDYDGNYNCNDKVIPLGSGFTVARDVNEAGAELTFAGEVQNSTVPLGGFSALFNYVGNCCPRNIKLGDIVANEVFFYSTIQFWTTGGANNKVTVGDLKNVSENYVYWPEGSGAADGKSGWYLEDDYDGNYNCNDKEIPAGTAFTIARDVNEADAVITIPAAL